MNKKGKRKNKLGLIERWEYEDYSYQKPFQCNTCKHYKRYPKCKIYGVIPSGVMKIEEDCKEYKKRNETSAKT
ncbi:MAG: hypothetical protein GX987_03770 [Tissierellia bacterium]|nr:hypothetical protein [Tissierellia bacterium]